MVMVIIIKMVVQVVVQTVQMFLEVQEQLIKVLMED